MTPVARIFDRDDQARNAIKALEAAGYERNALFIMGGGDTSPDVSMDAGEGESAAANDVSTPAQAPTPPASAEELVDQVRAAGELPITRAVLCVRALEQGKAVVVVGAPFGYVVRANSIMDDAGAAPAELMDTATPDNPSPFSDFLGMPCLEHRLSFLSTGNPLIDPDWTLFPVKLRDKLTFNVKLIDNPAWLSSKLGLKTLKTGKRQIFGVKLSDNPAWLSSKLGLKTLSDKRPTRTSFGFSLLTNQQE